MRDPESQTVFGCSLGGREDAELREIVWKGIKGGMACGRTKAGCWHINVAARKNALVAIGAEICMPNEHQLHRLIAELQKKSEDETVEFIESLPTIHAAAQQKKSDLIRSQILRP